MTAADQPDDVQAALAATDAHRTNVVLSQMVETVPQPVASAILRGLDRAELLHTLAVYCLWDLQEASEALHAHYGESAVDSLGIDTEAELYALDGTRLLLEILTEVRDALAAAGETEPDFEVTPAIELSDAIRTLRRGPLGHAAKGRCLPAAERLAFAEDRIEFLECAAAMSWGMAKYDRLGIMAPPVGPVG